MNYLLEVCLIALVLTRGMMSPVVAPSETPAHLPLQKGVSVELPVTRNAVPLPDADRADALIVTVTDSGSVYLGISLTPPAALEAELRDGLAKQLERRLYIKADARTPYANVAQILDAVRAAGIETPELLTAQTDSSQPGTVVSPKGLEVSLVPRLASSPQAIVLQMQKSGDQQPILKINDEQIPWAALQRTVRRLEQNRSERVVLIKADGVLPFADVIEATDICSSIGAKIVLVSAARS